MLESSDLVAFVATSDAERARAFYETTLGLRLLEQTPYACVFDAHGTQLRVTVAAQVSPAPYTVLGWAVADIEASVGELAERGVDFVRFDGMSQDALGVWTAPSGGRIAWFRDPDDNLLSVTQFS
ncbi:MAG: VOC family protein [Candidatus Dormibacteraeota bacterium]|uniref:Glyoxalase n=1 Tax=Candidatus Aeolococcus gillhamiae TaxID=3127015 RepID=A0A2W5ZE47_9BACT|nr:VOC family protein [Candidatus Dormibacteraeota bacterium]PZR83670.1 MAG: glyoxalase [Candidatus Dormibacter sp. RRmetagenome_bin12]